MVYGPNFQDHSVLKVLLSLVSPIWSGLVSCGCKHVGGLPNIPDQIQDNNARDSFITNRRSDGWILLSCASSGDLCALASEAHVCGYCRGFDNYQHYGPRLFIQQQYQMPQIYIMMLLILCAQILLGTLCG